MCFHFYKTLIVNILKDASKFRTFLTIMLCLACAFSESMNPVDAIEIQATTPTPAATATATQTTSALPPTTTTTTRTLTNVLTAKTMSTSLAAAGAAVLMERDNRTPSLHRATAAAAGAHLHTAHSGEADKIAIYESEELHAADTFQNTKHMTLPANRIYISKIVDLSSLSLLSYNETLETSAASTATTMKTAKHPKGSNSNSNSNSNNSKVHGTSATFQQGGQQRTNFKSTATTTPAATTTNNNSKTNNNNNNNAANDGSTAAANGNSSNSNKSNVRTSAKKVESKYILPKPQKTDAPMLNYIFDTYSSANKHHHHDQRYGPHFEDVQRVGQPTNMTVQAGSSIHLNCRISLLQDKTVSWVRRNSQGENALDLLTVGLHAYTGDERYKMEFQYPNNWRLKINNVKKDDEAMYECQISTHPPRVIQINLHVNAPKVMIVDEFGDPLQEKYYEIDSTLQLSCVVRNVAMSSSVVYWKHGEDVLNYDVTRGGVSVKTELMDDGANSTLFIAKINKSDSGNYTCSISDFQNFTIVVHILNGESFAELHHGGAATPHVPNIHHKLAFHLIILMLLLTLPPSYINR